MTDTSSIILQLVSDVADLKVKMQIGMWVLGATAFPAWLHLVLQFWKIKGDNHGIQR